MLARAISAILDHLPNPIVGLKEVSRVLKGQGRVVINAPNEKAVLAFRLTKPSQIWKIIFYKGYHYYALTLNPIRRILARTGFDVIQVQKKRRNGQVSLVC